MAAPERDAAEHRRRVLEHQTKLAAERKTSDPAPSHSQLRIPLVGEVKRGAGAQPPKRRRKGKQDPAQPRLGDF
jgi:hypothetical protein